MKRYQKFLSGLIILLLLTTASVTAQTLTGTVRDAQTREPLAGATVEQIQTGHGTVTDRNGEFHLELLDDGPRLVRVRFIGYDPYEIRVNWRGEREMQITLLPSAIVSEGVLVMAYRVDDRTPVTYSNVTREQIRERNMGQDIPMLLEMSPSVVSTSDAGAGIGYTGLRIRGVDPQRINVMVNGIPLNDSESHGVFWVNMPDFASSVDHVQIQRGVGTSALGPAAFGASVNLLTTTLQPDPYGEFHASGGSFNTLKSNVRVGTGLMANGWAFDGRLSWITSDGYIERASSDLRSFFVSGTRHSSQSLLKVNVFSGQERTYQAWYGVDADQLAENRRYNPAGRYTTPEGEVRYYDDQTDNYTQTHYQLHYSRELRENLSGNISLHYTRGAGYYEEYRSNNALSAYGFGPVPIGSEVITRTDLVRQRWLDNHFGGLTFSADYTPAKFARITFGGGWNHYDGDHFGEIVWTRVATPSELGERYYDNKGVKTDRNIYAKATADLSDRVSLFGDLQFRHIVYTLDGVNNNQRLLNDRHTFAFVNPKAGVTWDPELPGRFYAFVGLSGKEPVRRDFTDATENYQPRHETLYNIETGYRIGRDRWRVNLNYYYMWYRDQLINTGDINDVGDPVRTNVPESYRTGVELEASVTLTGNLRWSGNATWSRNRIPEFIERIDRYDENWAFAGQEEIIHKNTQIAFSPSLISSSHLSWQYSNLTMDWYFRFAGRQYLDNTTNKDRSLDPYRVSDLRLAWDHSGMDWVRAIRLQIMVYNLTDQRYESNGYTFGYFGGQTEYRENYYFPQAGRHFMAGVQLAF